MFVNATCNKYYSYLCPEQMNLSGGSHLGLRIGIKNPNFLEDLQMIFPGQFGFNFSSGLREEAF
jgi:hypothetical protein